MKSIFLVLKIDHLKNFQSLLDVRIRKLSIFSINIYRKKIKKNLVIRILKNSP